MGADQPDNADRCVELGIGIALDPLTVTPTEIAEATMHLLDDSAFIEAAAALAAEARSQPDLVDVPELRHLLGSSRL
jgi:UDP:flavonoid glycosyltransferase YjiC (YdhE family)